jgi:potassium efflux system protein
VILKQFLNLPSLFLVLCFTVWSSVGIAQSATGAAPNYEDWAETAGMVEETLVSGWATEIFLTKLREQLALRRAEFMAAQNVDEARLYNLKTQLEALGPMPEDGVEPSNITSRRVVLNTQFEALNAPRIRAKEAFERADGLIREVDGSLSAQQTANLLTLGPSPLDLRIWPAAIAQVSERLLALIKSVSIAWNTPVVRDKLRNQIPLIIFLLVLAGLLMTQGRRWMENAALRFRRPENRYTIEFAFYLRSLGQVTIVLLSLYFVARAWDISRLHDNNLALLLDHILWFLVPFFGSQWLALHLFSLDGPSKSLVSVKSALRPQARLITQLLGFVLSVQFFMEHLQRSGEFGDGTIAVYTFILVSVASIGAFRIGQILWTKNANLSEEKVGTKVPQGLVVRIGQILIVVSFVALILSAVGYSDAASQVLYPSLLTAGALAGLFLTFEAVRNLCAMLSEDEVAAHDGLTAVTINALLIMISLPAFALIWGARQSQLTELWTQFKSGVTLGDVQLSPGAVLELVIVFIIGLLFTRLIQRTLKTRILAKTKVDAGGQNAIVSGVGYLGIFVAALTAITSAGLDLSSLAIVAGALSVGIGFGLQNIVSNFVSGIILLIERPISVGDWIEVGGNMGIVSKISVRSTSIQTFDRTDVIVPNADLVSGTVTNYTHGSSVGRIILPVGVAYGNDTRKIEEILKPLAAAHPMVLLEPPPSVIFQGFGADSLNFEIRALLCDINYGLSVKSELNHKIAEALTANGIEIPFTQRDIWIRNPESLWPDRPDGA